MTASAPPVIAIHSLENRDTTRLSGLDWLRIALALYLVVFHTLPAYNGLPVWAYRCFSAGYVSTSLFFVLSGYVLAHVYLTSQGDFRRSPRQFLATRFAMLYPVHLLGFALAALHLAPQWLGSGQITAVVDIPPALRATTDLSETMPLRGAEAAMSAITNVLLLQAWNPHYQTFNIPAWSISALAFFYVVFALVAPRMMRTRRPGVWLAATALAYLAAPVFFIAQADYRPATTGLLHTNPLVRLPEFIAGMLMYRLMRDRPPPTATRVSPAAWVAVALACIVGMVTTLTPMGPAAFYVLHNGILLPAQLLLVAAAARFNTQPPPAVNRWVGRIANATLSIFILHLPLFSIAWRLEKWLVAGMPGVLGPALSWSTFWSRVKAPPLQIGLYPLILIIVLGLCVLVHERVVRQVRDWLLRDRRDRRCSPPAQPNTVSPTRASFNGWT